MTRVHTIRQAGEMAFIDYSGSLDRYSFLYPQSLSKWSITSCIVDNFKPVSNMSWKLNWFTQILPDRTFCSKGSHKGPDIFMSDDNAKQRGALHMQWEQATLFLSIFHFAVKFKFHQQFK